MANVRVELNYENVGKLLKSSEMAETLKARADEIAARAGTGYAADTKLMGTRVIASVYTETPEAMQDNLDNNTLLRALQ